MGKIDYNVFKQQTTTTGNEKENGRGPRVGYFTLRQDQDQAIVRFMIDSPDDFDIVAGHRKMIGGFNRMVNCIRDVKDPIEDCPLCANGDKLEYKFYIHLIEYVRDEKGNIVAVPRVWERSTAYTKTFTNLINEYGPLSDSVFKVTRNGQKGSTNTTYDITYCRPEVYKPELYVKNESLFKDYKAVGNAVLDFSKEKLQDIVNGIDPLAINKAAQSTQSEAVPKAAYNPNPNPQPAAAINFQNNNGSGIAVSPTSPMTAQASTQAPAGRRFY